IATGAPSGVFVVDVDPQHDGLVTWEALTREFGEPKTAKVRTPSTGFHLYFKCPTGVSVPCSVGRVGEGIDVRGNNGYAVGPGSRTAKGAYRWGDSSDIRDAPQWLLERVIAKPPTASSPGETGSIRVGEGGRNQYLATIAGRLRHLSHLPDEIEAL